jgi:ABC-type dipeptide/oligopeptide/nickel transport system permease component
MLKYIIKKIILMIPVLIGMTIVVFLLLHLAPGNPVDLIAGPRATPETIKNIEMRLGLDKPLIVQYFKFLENLARGDFGISILQRRPVMEIIKEALPVTVELGIASLLVSFILAVPLGIMAAVYRNTWRDYISMSGALVAMSVPAFWLGLIAIYVFAYNLRWFPVSGYGTWRHLVLPLLAITLTEIAVTARMVRSSMLEVIKQDYIRTARSKGLEEKSIIMGHALKNAMIPVVTMFGLKIGWIVGGATIIEIVFARPGLGRMMVNAIYARDYPVVQGAMIVLTAAIIIGNLIADILYVVVDPRIKY